LAAYDTQVKLGPLRRRKAAPNPFPCVKILVKAGRLLLARRSNFTTITLILSCKLAGMWRLRRNCGLKNVFKDAPVEFDLPQINSAQEAAQAASAILSEVASGVITPLEGATVMGLLEQYRKTLETSEFKKRIEALEART
jgi:hypothetical protein